MSTKRRRYGEDKADYRRELQKAARIVDSTDLAPSLGAVAFFDLPGSTSLMKRDPREAIPVMLLHNAMCRVIVESNGGYVVKELGDGLMVHFVNIGAGAKCALEVIQNLLQYGESIRTKVSIAVGAVWKVESRHGGYDVYGTPVHMSARMSEHARENTILIDARERNLVAEWLGRDTVITRSEKIKLRNYGPTNACRILVKKS